MSLGLNAFKCFIGTSIFILRYIDHADNKGRCKIKRKILLKFGPQPPTPIDGKNKINEKWSTCHETISIWYGPDVFSRRLLAEESPSNQKLKIVPYLCLSTLILGLSWNINPAELVSLSVALQGEIVSVF